MRLRVISPKAWASSGSRRSSLADQAREAKTQTIFYGTSGVGSSQHFNGELLNEAMRIQLTPGPYRGGNEALLDLAAGRIDLVVGTLGGLLPSIEAGRAKAIAVMGKTRSAALPNVQTTAEAGYPAATTENYVKKELDYWTRLARKLNIFAK